MTSPAPPEASPQSAAHLAQPSTTSFAHLITPEVIKKAKYAWCIGPLKTVQVLNTQYTVKLGPGVTNYEYRVLQFLDTLPHVPTPRPLAYFDMDVTVDRKLIGGLREETDKMETWHVIVMSTIPGQTLTSSGLDLKEGQAVTILEEVRDSMDAINTAIEAGAKFPDRNDDWSILRHDHKSISDLDRDEGQCLELPLLEGLIKGQVRVDDFAKVMGPTAPQLDEKKELLNSVLNYLQPTTETSRQTDGSSDIRFCHMDLHQGNIMVKDGALSGIIDWELAGWYTWALEVCGGLRLQRHPIQIAQYIEAWEVSSELRSVAVDARKRLKLGVRECKRIKPDSKLSQGPSKLNARQSYVNSLSPPANRPPNLPPRVPPESQGQRNLSSPNPPEPSDDLIRILMTTPLSKWTQEPQRLTTPRCYDTDVSFPRLMHTYITITQIGAR